MATLDNKSIRDTLSSVFRYNDNPDKNLPPDGLSAAAAYIRGEHSIERLYSLGHNGCSCNPKLAIEQFRACEALYRQNKGGAREAGLSDGKQPIVAEHIFISFPPHENVPYKTQCEIVDKLCASDVLNDFYAVSNRHWNTDNDHTHLLVCNTSKDGSRKLGMNNAKRNELRKELDRICALEYGLSVIDDPGLRWKDPEREAFIRKLVDEGKVNVYAPADFEKLYENYKRKTGKTREYDEWMLKQIRSGRVLVAEGVSYNRTWDEEKQKYHGATQAEAYKKWVAAQENFVREKDKKAAKNAGVALVHKDDAKSSRVYYWEPKYKSSKEPDYYYAVRRYDQFGYHKPILLLMLELILIVSKYEGEAYFEKYPNATMNVQRNWRLQNMYDSIRLQEEQGVRTPSELNGRIQSVGTDLSEARRGLSYYKSTIENGDDLHTAIRTFKSLEKDDLSEDEELVRKEAYRIMAAHKCTSNQQIDDFMRRRQFAEKKVSDLEEQVKKLKKDYHELKFIESHSAESRAEIESYVFSNAGRHSLDDILRRSEQTQKTAAKRSQEKEKTF